MRLRLAVLAAMSVSAFLLAGCSSHAPAPAASVAAAPAPDARVARDPAAPAAVGPHQDVLGFDGGLKGAGVVSPAETGFAGESTIAQPFGVADNATKLSAVLTWSGPPADIYLELVGPNGLVFMDDAADPLGATVTYPGGAALAGDWHVMAWAQGPAVGTYHIDVTVDYAS